MHVDKFGKEIVDIRNGKYSLEEILQMFDQACSLIEKRVENGEVVVPYAPDWSDIRALLSGCLEEKYGSLKNFGYNILNA